MLASDYVITGDAQSFENDVLTGLALLEKRLPCRWLYDDRGSKLFEAITNLPEYYPTRVETALLKNHVGNLRALAGTGGDLVEYGAGAGIKTEILLGALEPDTYIPIDVADDFLVLTAQRLRSAYPELSIAPIVADFTQDFNLPRRRSGHARTGFFPGSTIGNLDPQAVNVFLHRMRCQLGPYGKAVIGVDLVKDSSILIPAYDDAAGITAAFNLNLLIRINRELGGDFDLTQFRHRAVWNADELAIEMRIESLIDQVVRIAGLRHRFRAGETIHTESSRKYTIEGFTCLAQQAGWCVHDVLVDEAKLFSVFLLDIRS